MPVDHEQAGDPFGAGAAAPDGERARADRPRVGERRGHVVPGGDRGDRPAAPSRSGHRDGRGRRVPGLPSSLGSGRDRLGGRGREASPPGDGRRCAPLTGGKRSRGAAPPARDRCGRRDRWRAGRATGRGAVGPGPTDPASGGGGDPGTRPRARRPRGGDGRVARPAPDGSARGGGGVRASGHRAHPRREPRARSGTRRGLRWRRSKPAAFRPRPPGRIVLVTAGVRRPATTPPSGSPRRWPRSNRGSC